MLTQNDVTAIVVAIRHLIERQESLTVAVNTVVEHVTRDAASQNNLPPAVSDAINTIGRLATSSKILLPQISGHTPPQATPAEIA
ncbi:MULTISPECIES: hypothetical protein [Sorangium]|uniref:hypothetical protein n=1 Tax=Sorangium TaxID=39643 RepID=UPI003D9C5D30